MGDLRVDDEGEKSLTQERLASRRRAQEGEAFILAIGAKCWLKLKRNQQSRTIPRRGRHTGAGTAHGRDGTAYMRGEGPAPTHACGDRYSATPARYPSSAKPPPRHKPHTRCPSNPVNPNRSQSSWRPDPLVVSPGMRGGAGGVSTPVPTFALALVPTIGAQARHRGHRERKHDDRQ